MNEELKPCPLLGEWRANEGYLCCGTLRIAHIDFDTHPAPEFCREVFEWIAAKLNTRPAAERGEETAGVVAEKLNFYEAQNAEQKLLINVARDLLKLPNEQPLLAGIRALTRQLAEERGRGDKERLDWLEYTVVRMDIAGMPPKRVYSGSTHDPSIREAIDKAMTPAAAHSIAETQGKEGL